MKFFTKAEPIPAAAVTYAGALSDKQPIIFTSQARQKDLDGRRLDWVITSIKVTTARDWSISRADIIITSEIPDQECLTPTLPDLSVFRGGNFPYLTVEDEIRIFMGYIRFGQLITADLLDDHAFDLCPSCTDQEPTQESNPNSFVCGPTSPSGENFKQDPAKPLCPVFWGFIDVINIDVDPNSGVRCSISCRDRSRVFADTTLIAIPSLQGRLIDTSQAGFLSSNSKEGLAAGKREDILIQVARGATGELFGDLTMGNSSVKKCWKPVIGGSDDVVDNYYNPPWLNQQSTSSQQSNTKPPNTNTIEEEGTQEGVEEESTQEEGEADEFGTRATRGNTSTDNTSQSSNGSSSSATSNKPSELGALLFNKYQLPQGAGDYTLVLPPEDPALWMREAQGKKHLPYTEPRFHIWVQRPPLSKGNSSAVFKVINKSPFEIIKFLADTEERPTDFFCSHINGDFVFGPRVLDSSGFYDPYRQYRTYFNRLYPKEFQDKKIPVSDAQRIISMRAVTSSLATMNRFVVVDSETEGSFSSFLDKLRVAVDVLPWLLDGDETSDNFKESGGRNVYPPCRNQILYDGNISSYGKNKYNRAGGALIVALNQARNWSREIMSISMTLMGDPTLYPGEAVRVYNSILHDFGTKVNPGTQKSTEILRKSMEDIESLSTDTKRDVIDKIVLETKSDFSASKPPENRYDIDEQIDKGTSSIDFGNEGIRELTKSLYSHHVLTSMNDLVLPVYKVRSIQHTFRVGGKNPGFTTKIECISDY